MLAEPHSWLLPDKFDTNPCRALERHATNHRTLYIEREVKSGRVVYDDYRQPTLGPF